MKTAAKGASRFLIDKAKDDPKLNPVPYPFFKAILEKQIEWARQNRHKNLVFDELAEVVKRELLKSDIHVMLPNKSKNEHEEYSLFAMNDDDVSEFPEPLNIYLGDTVAVSRAKLMGWTDEAFHKAAEGTFIGIQLSITGIKEADHV